MESVKPVRPTRPVRTIDSRQSYRSGAQGAKLGSALSKLAVFAPIALEAAVYLRGQQKAKRGKYYKSSTKGKAFDFLLEQAHKRFGQPASKKKGWF